MKLKILNAMAKIFPNEIYGNEQTQGSMLQNELYHFSFCLTNDNENPLYYASVVIESDLGDSVRCYKIGYVPALYTKRLLNTDDYTIRGKAGLYPDPLGGCNQTDQVFPPMVNIGFLVEVDGAKTPLPSGKHPIKIALKDKTGQDLCSGIFTIDIIGEELPQSDLLLTQWIHYDCIAHAHKTEAFSECFYDVCKSYFRTARRYGQTMVIIPLFTFPLDTEIGGERETFQGVGIEVKDGQYIFDFSNVRRLIETAFACGFRYIEFSHMFTQWGAKHAPKIMATVNGEYRKIFGWETDSLGEDYGAFLQAFLPALYNFIVENHLKDKCFIHISDEPKEETLERYCALKSMVKKYLPDISTLDALSEYAYYEQGLVDLPAVATDAVDRFTQNNASFLIYYCNCQSHEYLSNRFLDMPSQRNRVLGFQLYEVGAKGFLHWALNFYNSSLSYFSIDPYKVTDAGGFFQAGDSFVVYPTENGCTPSLRLAVFYDGIQDYLALKKLEQSQGRAYVLDILHGEAVKGVKEYPRSDEWHLHFREKINRLIQKASEKAKER